MLTLVCLIECRPTCFHVFICVCEYVCVRACVCTYMCVCMCMCVSAYRPICSDVLKGDKVANPSPLNHFLANRNRKKVREDIDRGKGGEKYSSLFS